MSLKEELRKSGNWLFRYRSYMPLLVVGLFFLSLRKFKYPYDSPELDLAWEIFCLFVSLLGFTVRILTVGYAPRGTSGRNTRGQLAETLNTTGMYSIVQHPLYLGNFLMWLGVCLAARSGWFLLTVLLIFVLYYERIIYVEEEFLHRKFGRAYEDWAKRTPTFFLKFRNFRRPDLGFSFKTVLRREHSGLFALILLFTAVDAAQEFLVRKELHLDKFWTTLCMIAFLLYVTLRTLKKHTKLLDVQGR